MGTERRSLFVNVSSSVEHVLRVNSCMKYLMLLPWIGSFLRHY